MEYIIEKSSDNKKEEKKEEIKLESNKDELEVSKEEIYTLKKNIINNSKNLKKIEYIQIFKIIYKYNIQYMENINGIFINLNKIDYNILKEIDILINYIKSKNKELDDKEKILKRLNLNN